MDPSLPPPAPRMSFATELAFLGLVVMAVGWFLPWLARLEADGFRFTPAELRDLEEQERRAGAPDDLVAVTRRVRENGYLTGRDLAALAGAPGVRSRSSLTPSEDRAWGVAVAFLRWAPFVAAGAAALLLLGRLRKPGVLVGTLALVIALAVSALVGLLWLGASQTARESVVNDPGILGMGMWAIHAGAVLALVGGLFSVRASTWWKIYLLTVVSLVAAGVGLAWHINPS